METVLHHVAQRVYTHTDGIVCTRPACPTCVAQRRWSTDFGNVVFERKGTPPSLAARQAAAIQALAGCSADELKFCQPVSQLPDGISYRGKLRHRGMLESIRHVVPCTPPSNMSPASITNGVPCLPHTCPVTSPQLPSPNACVCRTCIAQAPLHNIHHHWHVPVHPSCTAQ